MDIPGIEVLHDHAVRLRFADGTERSIDLLAGIHSDRRSSRRSRSIPRPGRSRGLTALTSHLTSSTKDGARPGWRSEARAS